MTREERRSEKEEERRREELRLREEFVFAGPFDTNGVLYHIGTEWGTTDYQNPHSRGHVVANRSSNAAGTAEDFVGREKKASYSQNAKGSWMSVDLGPTRRLQVRHYCLRHGHTYKHTVLRNWRFEGSNDGFSWSLLRQHDNDASMGSVPFGEGHWEVSNSLTYRYFRIFQHGINSNGDYVLHCCGMELYGKLTVT